MANHKSAVKRARQAEKRRARNRAVKSEVRHRVKAVRTAVASGDSTAAAEQLKVAERVLRKAASKGVVPKTTASRSVSRLAKAVHGLQA